MKNIFCCCIKKKSLFNITSETNFNPPLSQRSSVYQRKRTILKELIELNKMNEWDQIKENLNKKVKVKSFKSHFLSFFKDNSTYMKSWNTFFSLFVVIVVYLYFLKIVFVDMHLNLEEEKSELFIYTYYMINLVFSIDCINSLVRLFINLSTFTKCISIIVIIPLKLFISIPFSLNNENISFILIKFFRVDLIHTLFTVVRVKSDSIIRQFIHNQRLKIYLVFFNAIFKFLLTFILYAHFCACLNVIITLKNHQKNNIQHDASYIEFLYFSFTIFTTVGYGDIFAPYNILSMLIGMINMIFGVELFGIIIYYIQLLFTQLKDLKREELFQNFEMFISKMENNSGRVMPKYLRDAMYACYALKMGISFNKLFINYENLFKSCKKEILDELKNSIFEFIDGEYNVFFRGCSKEFRYDIYSKLRPRMYFLFIIYRFKPGKLLIDYEAKVKKLYFLLYGSVSIYNESHFPFILYPTSSLIGDWPFLTDTLSEFKYIVNEQKFAVGFVLDKKSFKEITDRNIGSSQEFFKISQNKIEFIKRIKKSFNFSTPFLRVSDDTNLATVENKRKPKNKLSNADNDKNVFKLNKEEDLNILSDNKTTIAKTKSFSKSKIKNKLSEYKVNKKLYLFLLEQILRI